MMKNNLYLLTDFFPYGLGEKSFILPELPCLQEKFNVTILSCATLADRQNREQETELDSTIRVIHYDKGMVTGKEVLRYLPAFMADRECRREIRRIIATGKYLLKRVKSCLFFYANAVKLKKWLIENDLLDQNGLYYSYWYNYRVLSLVMLKESVGRIVTRAHGYDLYEDQTNCEWQPFKRFMDQYMDKAVFISKHGYEYYMKRYATAEERTDKYQICRLGAARQEVPKREIQRDFFLLVSCSSVISVKRIYLIVEALSQIDVCRVKWVHFGDGDLLEDIRKDAERLLESKENIVYELKGNFPNQEILSYYRKEVPDAIIMTSRSEGSPVALQEALACGSPIIATKVGGIPELVDGNGILLEPDPLAAQIADAICTVCMMDETERASMRRRSRELWEDSYDISRNMHKFVDCLEKLMKGK